MKPNYLNNAFTPVQARAIEKYVASFVADVLKSYEAGPVEVKKDVAKPAKVKHSDSNPKDILEAAKED